MIYLPINSVCVGDSRDVLRTLPDECVQMCVTSPPYWGLRNYGTEPLVWGGDPDCDHTFDSETIDTEIGRGNWTQGTNGRGEVQPGGVAAKRVAIRSTVERGYCRHCGAWRGHLGLEPTPELYVSHIVEIFRDVRRVLRSDGTLWLNIGDSYATGGKPGYKPKDLIGMPWRVAFALQADGWTLRRDIIWHKPNAMPESVKDRPTTDHEYIFLLSKSAKYYYDAEAIKVPASADTHARYARGRGKTHKWSDGGPGNQTIARSLAHMLPGVTPKSQPPGCGVKVNHSFHAATSKYVPATRNKRSVWRVNVACFSGAHFATFPPKLIEPCILAGSRPGDTVLDPFFGSGTTGMVSEEHGRQWIGIDLNPEYKPMAEARMAVKRTSA